MPDLAAQLRVPRARAACAVLAGLLLASGGCSRQSPLAPQLSPSSSLLPVASGDAESQVLVTIAPGADPAQLAADYGATMAGEEDWGCVELLPAAGESPDALAARMAGDSRVVTAERNGYLETAETRQQSFAFDDGLGSQQTYLEQPAAEALGLPLAQEISRGEDVVVAILDTGADLTHPALAGRIVGGRDFVDGDYDPTDSGDGLDSDGDGQIDEARGHGTHVAGLVALTAPRARLLIVRVLDADGRGDMTAVAAGIRWSLSHGARVMNFSLGSLRTSEAVQKSLEEAEVQRVVSVAAAGNWGSQDPTEYPAISSYALAVAAIDVQDRPASFSSFGNHVALSAPGVSIRSAYLNGGFALWSGTSMSVPFVAGTAALLLSLHPDWGSPQIMMRMADTARPVVADPALQLLFGAGALDAAAALAPDDPRGGDGTDPAPPRVKRP